MKDALFTAKIKARYILHFWATYDGGNPAPSQLRGVVIPEFDCPMNSQEAHLTVYTMLKSKGHGREFSRYLARCYKQDGNWWLWGIYPTPPTGCSNYIKLREEIEADLTESLFKEESA